MKKILNPSIDYWIRVGDYYKIIDYPFNIPNNQQVVETGEISSICDCTYKDCSYWGICTRKIIRMRNSFHELCGLNDGKRRTWLKVGFGNEAY